MKRPPLVDLATHAHPWVSVPELADYLDCNPRTILRMIDRLKGYRVGRSWRVPTVAAREAFPVQRQRPGDAVEAVHAPDVPRVDVPHVDVSR